MEINKGEYYIYFKAYRLYNGEILNNFKVGNSYKVISIKTTKNFSRSSSDNYIVHVYSDGWVMGLTYHIFIKHFCTLVESRKRKIDLFK